MRLAGLANCSEAPVLVMVDADDDCSTLLGKELKLSHLSLLQSKRSRLYFLRESLKVVSRCGAIPCGQTGPARRLFGSACN